MRFVLFSLMSLILFFNIEAATYIGDSYHFIADSGDWYSTKKIGDSNFTTGPDSYWGSGKYIGDTYHYQDTDGTHISIKSIGDTDFISSYSEPDTTINVYDFYN
jgi:hypothetical protein